MYYLGIDNGGSMTKAALFDESGTLISVCSEKSSFFTRSRAWKKSTGISFGTAT